MINTYCTHCRSYPSLRSEMPRSGKISKVGKVKCRLNGDPESSIAVTEFGNEFRKTGLKKSELISYVCVRELGKEIHEIKIFHLYSPK